VLATVALAVAFTCWRYLHPRIRTATYDEVIAVLPKELLEPQAPDNDAEIRLAALFNVLQSFEIKELSLLSAHPGRTSLEAMGAADKVWHDGRFAKVMRILKSGPIQFPVVQSRGRRRGYIGPRDPNELYSKLKQMTKGLVDSASAYEASGDLGEAMFCLRSLILISDRIWHLNGGLVHYFVSASIEVSALRAVSDYARNPMSPIADCQELLRLLPASPEEDRRIAECLRIHFQQNILPKLPDPYRNSDDRDVSASNTIPSLDAADPAFETSYDALATSKEIGKVYAIEMANTLRPFSRYDNSAEKIQRNARNRLPMPPGRDDVDQRLSQVERIRYRVATYNTDNYFGRVMIGYDIDDKELVNRSAVCRAMRSAVRVLLASRLYRNSHNGELPKDEDGFIPILRSWPNDPYTGNPLIYRRSNSVVYSIGKNLIDNGGSIAGFNNDSLDIGLQLTFDR